MRELLRTGRAARRVRRALSARILRRAAPARLHRSGAGERAQLIIADEAVAALDVSIRAQVVNLLMDLQARLGVAYLFISHDMAVVERVAHRVAVMYLGQIVEIGPRQAVFERSAACLHATAARGGAGARSARRGHCAGAGRRARFRPPLRKPSTTRPPLRPLVPRGSRTISSPATRSAGLYRYEARTDNAVDPSCSPADTSRFPGLAAAMSPRRRRPMPPKRSARSASTPTSSGLDPGRPRTTTFAVGVPADAMKASSASTRT